MATPLRFAVDERPVAIWVHDQVEVNREFLNAANPDQYTELASSLWGDAESVDDLSLNSTLGLRIVYGLALESLMAYLVGAAQAPHCLFGWLDQYSLAELKSAVRKLSTGTLKYSMVDCPRLCWEELSIVVHSNLQLEDKNSEAEIKKGFGQLWQDLAREFLDESSRNEFNTIKHGLRTSLGGFSLAIGLQQNAGTPCPPEGMMSLGGEKFGLSFFETERIEKSKTNLSLKLTSRNWSVRDMMSAILLISTSLKNVIGCLKIQHGIDPKSIDFTWPTGEDCFRAPWSESPRVRSSSMGCTPLGLESEVLEADEILDQYNQ